MKTFEIIAVYGLLKGVKFGELAIEDVKRIITFRNTARPIVENFEKTRQEVEESFRPDNFDELVELERKGKERTEEETAKYLAEANAYRTKINEALVDELNKECETTFETLSADAIAILAGRHEWGFEELDVIELLK